MSNGPIRMLKVLAFIASAAVQLPCAVNSSALAESPSHPAHIVAATPPGLIEVATSGTWHHGSHLGTYRALVIQSGPDDRRTASVFVQWLAAGDDGELVSIAMSAAITEFNALGLASASISLDTVVDNEADLTISAPEAANPAHRQMLVKATLPGHYIVMPSAPPPPGVDAAPAVADNPPSATRSAMPRRR
jgi:hypothetical protein